MFHSSSQQEIKCSHLCTEAGWGCCWWGTNRGMGRGVKACRGVESDSRGEDVVSEQPLCAWQATEVKSSTAPQPFCKRHLHPCTKPPLHTSLQQTAAPVSTEAPVWPDSCCRICTPSINKVAADKRCQNKGSYLSFHNKSLPECGHLMTVSTKSFPRGKYVFNFPNQRLIRCFCPFTSTCLTTSMIFFPLKSNKILFVTHLFRKKSCYVSHESFFKAEEE